MTEHKLKTAHKVFDEVWNGRKQFEFRKNDRDFKVGDTLILQEINDDLEPTGRQWRFEASYILYGPDYGVPEGFCVISCAARKR